MTTSTSVGDHLGARGVWWGAVLRTMAAIVESQPFSPYSHKAYPRRLQPPQRRMAAFSDLCYSNGGDRD